jgi:hypothetical protein
MRRDAQDSAANARSPGALKDSFNIGKLPGFSNSAGSVYSRLSDIAASVGEARLRQMRMLSPGRWIRESSRRPCCPQRRLSSDRPPHQQLHAIHGSEFIKLIRLGSYGSDHHFDHHLCLSTEIRSSVKSLFLTKVDVGGRPWTRCRCLGVKSHVFLYSTLPP